MKTKKIAVLQGDYIGPEIMSAGLEVLEAARQGTDFEYQIHKYNFGGEAIDKCGEPLPQSTIEGCKSSDAILLSAIGGPKWDKASVRPEAGLLTIRNELGLFANIRPTKINPILARKSPIKEEVIQNTDFVIVRELTSGIYFGTPRKKDEHEAIDTSSYTVEEIERIMHIGFEMSMHRKKHVTVVDKANVLATSKLWREVAQKMSNEYPQVEVDYCYVDAAAMKIITQPSSFDVVITANLFGDILSDEASVLTGSLGTIPSMSTGVNGPSLYEPIHGSAPDIAGKGIADPISMIQSIEMMLRESFAEYEIADRIARAVEQTIETGIVTPDLGGKATTKEVIEQIIENLRG
ncbi:3-isopropylmalate dehydrogenase [Liquorilactobacillus mali]|uniref:3-isopropylmalate dehydrogenase n=1 Tax=Liquorilactobacillus mali KCTC 3596 = DSM 20444 TaxID=1046596 RepID=J1F020_9LACO|nr:3-isopropylmalate dehydrogenase [Liquorilactobacillus mali]EJE97288.1 3-isopropylmalate dehydrogenase [Liquorilactobacillus mali KCTC 3596 = DSM 20444]KRN11325.1 3-isopropylmalate dehydrogenase [Liquorilactobacillus mali KCTC 3596 = DSM 20444]MDC7953170.1 3-isopropylmalate dehydrogenase [Liquorilactobacillus mali]MDV7757237.1 3-isopropylmalate dehydrogenase [Liquorilactobacillus mali]QFQ75338.1 3-isopropylmalate dehydrogenase [Liquorilactobacillus mali]